jgi:hypothetical protein
LTTTTLTVEVARRSGDTLLFFILYPLYTKKCPLKREFRREDRFKMTQRDTPVEPSNTSMLKKA